MVQYFVKYYHKISIILYLYNYVQVQRVCLTASKIKQNKLKK